MTDADHKRISAPLNSQISPQMNAKNANIVFSIIRVYLRSFADRPCSRTHAGEARTTPVFTRRLYSA
ncbi:MAG TPA: hypothetical protein VN599_10210, partial [Rudaea sp.]|nr:hypothetical protein [Rudaea sp.]